MLGNLASLTVPEVIEEPSIAATLNVPYATMSTISDAVAPEANTTDVPELTVTSVPLTNLTPLR